MSMILPPLNALRAFEAAARHGSFVAAAEDLGISPAAISQHVRKLEDFMGKEMFTRRNNGVVLTDAGQALFSGTASALRTISQTTGDLISNRSRSRLVISSLESVAEKWLAPRLIQFAARHPGFRFDLRVEPDPVDLVRHNIDLRLCYGPNPYPDHEVKPLALDQVQPMCSPAYLERHPQLARGGMAFVAEADLLHTSWGPDFGSHPGWRAWFHKAGLPIPAETGGFGVARSGLALDLARGGLGVALAQRMMAGPDLAEGRLVCLSQVSIPLGHPYGLASPRARSRKREVLALTAWLSDPATSDLPANPAP